MKDTILILDLFSMLVLAIVIYGAIFESKFKRRKAGIFFSLAFCTFLAIGFDAIGCLPLRWELHPTLRWAQSFLAFVTPFFSYNFFLHYIYTHITEKNKIRPYLFSIGSIYCLIGIASTIYYSITGDIFYIDFNGNCVLGRYYSAYLMTFLVAMFVIVFMTIVHWKELQTHDSIATLMFMAIPIFFIAINYYYPELEFAPASMALSILLMNTMLNSERESILISNEKQSTMLAHTDELTGLQNRLAYNKFCESVPESGKMGLIFSDVNGLKYANDNFGHKAGDTLLCEYSVLLLSYFSKNSIFRISGDEFVVVLNDINEEEFLEKKNLVLANIQAMDIPIAALGFSYGIKKDFLQLLENAEKEMYYYKKIFHQKHPEYGRGTAKEEKQ